MTFGICFTDPEQTNSTSPTGSGGGNPPGGGGLGVVNSDEAGRGRLHLLANAKFYRSLFGNFQTQVSKYKFQNGRLTLAATPSFHRSFARVLKKARALLRSNVELEGGLYRVPRTALRAENYRPGPRSSDEGEPVYNHLKTEGNRLHQLSFQVYDRYRDTLEIRHSGSTLRDLDVSVTEGTIAYETSSHSEETRTAFEFLPLISREGKQVRLTVRNIYSDVIESDVSTAVDLFKPVKNDSGVLQSEKTGEQPISLSRKFHQGGAWNVVVSDGDWLFLNAGPAPGAHSQTDDLVLALRLSVVGEAKPFPEPRPTPQWKQNLQNKLSNETIQDVPSGDIRMHSLMERLRDQTSLNFYLDPV